MPASKVMESMKEPLDFVHSSIMVKLEVTRTPE
jgi:hypothetical protein